jgi:DNA-binding MurR/RpiR family transcriptional regulator
VRFSQALGFEGFPELQQSAREEYRRRTAASASAASDEPLFSLDQNEFETAIASDHVNVEETARKVSRSDVEAAVEAIAGAGRVLICGTDQMAFFASYLRHLLMLLDLRAEIVASPSQEALSRLGRIDDQTLVIGLSAGRPHPLVVRAMKLARHRKARTIAITDATLSEVAKLAQIKLYYSSNRAWM